MSGVDGDVSKQQSNEIAELRATVEFLTGHLHRHHYLLSGLLKGFYFGEWERFGRGGYHLTYLRGEMTWSDEETAQVDAELGWCPPVAGAAS